MSSQLQPRYTLTVNGHAYAVEIGSAGWGTVGRLFVDGMQVDERKSSGNRIRLEGGGLAVEVRLNWLDRVTEILALPKGDDPTRIDVEGTAFSPPAGSHAARLERLKRTHPELYAARHVVFATIQVLVGVVGIGALISGLLPRVDLPPVPFPDLPAIPWPRLPAIPLPKLPMPDVILPDLGFLEPMRTLWSSISWLVPIVIAAVVAINEVRKHRKRGDAAAARQRSTEPTASTSSTMPVSTVDNT